jgi:hypothetical protein
MILRAQGKVIGEYANNVFTKQVKISKHLFRVLDAWGIDKTTLDSFLSDTQIQIHETEQNKTYYISVEDFRKHAVEKHFKGYGPQYFCPRRHFNSLPPAYAPQSPTTAKML